MQRNKVWQICFSVSFVSLLSGCMGPIDNSTKYPTENGYPYSRTYNESRYSSSMPTSVNYGHEKVIVVDPKKFAWGAYNADGELVRGGVASTGQDFCADIGRPCKTATGTFRLTSLGGPDCVSSVYPRPKGGALMPYCMFFHGGQSLHGSPDHLFNGTNISHGCVHLRIPDAEWLRYNFATVGTKVIILPY